MTEKYIYSNGVALLEEWEDVNYCEHSFKFKDEWLTDKEVVDLLNKLNDENKRLIDKLNKTALELVDECISQGKATEISEMSYREFLDYRAENGKPMELHL